MSILAETQCAQRKNTGPFFTRNMKTSLYITDALARGASLQFSPRRKVRKVNLNYFVFINLSVPCASARA